MNKVYRSFDDNGDRSGETKVSFSLILVGVVNESRCGQYKISRALTSMYFRTNPLFINPAYGPAL